MDKGWLLNLEKLPGSHKSTQGLDAPDKIKNTLFTLLCILHPRYNSIHAENQSGDNGIFYFSAIAPALLSALTPVSLYHPASMQSYLHPSMG